MAQVYVDDLVMAEWKTNMNSINQNCITAIEGIESSIKNLNESLMGNYSEQYDTSINSFLKSVKNSHENLKDMESFLDQVVEVMKNQ